MKKSIKRRHVYVTLSNESRVISELEKNGEKVVSREPNPGTKNVVNLLVEKI